MFLLLKDIFLQMSGYKTHMKTILLKKKYQSTAFVSGGRVCMVYTINFTYW